MTDRGLRRMVMVVASQWPAGDGADLDFLPPSQWAPGVPLTDPQHLAVDLYEQFLDRDAGACDPVPGLALLPGVSVYQDSTALVINPTVQAANRAFTHAFEQAQTHQRVLVVHYIGHGIDDRPTKNSNLNHRLPLIDSPTVPQTSYDAWNPYRGALELLQSSFKPPGFVFLVDACHAAAARPEVALWGTDTSAHVWMGSSQHSNAFDGCFSRTLLEVMRRGDLTRAGVRPVAEIHSRDLRPVVDARCVNLEEGKVQEADDIASKSDSYLFITRNRAIEAYESSLGLTDTTRDRLRSAVGDHYQLIDVAAVTRAIAEDPFVVLTGGAGSGKTALAAVLRDPPDGLDVRRVDALTFLEPSSDLTTIAQALHPQLLKHTHYADLHRRYERTPEIENTTAHERYISGPLDGLSDGDRVVLCLDGLDQLDARAQPTVLDAYRDLVARTNGRVRVLTTSRPASAGGPIPEGAHTVAMPELSEPTARNYLGARGLRDGALQDRVLNLSAELNWLVVTLAGDQIEQDPTTSLTDDEAQLYRNIVDASIHDLGRPAVEPIIDVLAASGEVAGVGPKLPYEIFAQAVAKLGGPADLDKLNQSLSHPRLYRIIERSNPATDEEHLGLFHLTAIRALTPADERRKAAHGAITDVLDAIQKSASE